VSALHKAAFGGLVAQIGGIVEKFGGFYPGGHPADLRNILADLEAKPAD
jgi:hypothetical protein